MKKIYAYLRGIIAYILCILILCDVSAEAGTLCSEKGDTCCETYNLDSHCVMKNPSQTVNESQNEFVVYGGIQNPVHRHNDKNYSKDKTTVSYVYYGLYPQKEITNKKVIKKIDRMVKSTGKDDVFVDGKKYRRLKKSRTTNSNFWGTEKYHYFLWQPIKWRVLAFEDDNTMFLMADLGLDCQAFNLTENDRTNWKNSTVRSWLNCYSANRNSNRINYSQTGFLNTAFTKSEKKYLVASSLETPGCERFKTPGCGTTNDKVFLLSYEDVINEKYGFCPNEEGKQSFRQMKVTNYCHMMGGHYDEHRKGSGFVRTADWWLRSPGAGVGPANTVDDDGYIKYYGEWSKNKTRAVVPAIRVKYTQLIPQDMR